MSGRHVSEEELRKDLKTMKQNNINAIRTCHYPDASMIYELCDEYGIYMIDETNLGITWFLGRELNLQKTTPMLFLMINRNGWI